MLEVSIKVKNYKCFADDPQGFDKIYPINIIIGKNNSGKSSLIDLINYLVEPNDKFIKTGRNKMDAQVVVTDILTKKSMEGLPKDASPMAFKGKSYYDYGLTLVDQKMTYSLGYDDNKSALSWERTPADEFSSYIRSVLDKMSKPLNSKRFKRINAERDILPQGANESDLSVKMNGEGATNLVYQIINHSKHDYQLVKKKLLTELNRIINPDIEFKDILPRHNGNGIMEIYFEYKEGESIALSKMGSGLKTIILVLLNMIVIPVMEEKVIDDYVFGFEELENNLHPSLQRRLFNYIADYAIKNNCIFFITTHSSIIIDLFASDKNAQIIHVENTGTNSVTKMVATHSDSRNVLKDLDSRASDILLSNGVIWVEGPSDAIYLELLLDLYKKKINYSKNINFCIQSLSTAIWKYAGFADFDWDDINTETENKIISLAKINHNHLIIIDKDDNYEDIKPSEWENFKNGNGKNKARLIFESMKFACQNESELSSNFGDTNDRKLFFWVNDGSFETYLEYFVSNKGAGFNMYFELNKRLGYFEKKREGENSSRSKVELAAEIAKFALQNELTFEDFASVDSPLLNKVERLLRTIESWN